MAGPGGERSGVRLQRRGARLRLPRRTAQPARITRPAYSAASPQAARPHPERARERVAGSRQGGADPRTRCPRDAGMHCSRLEDQLNNSAPFAVHRGVSNSECAPGFCLLPAALGRHSVLSLALNIKVQSSFVFVFFFPHKDHCILLRQRDAFLKGHT